MSDNASKKLFIKTYGCQMNVYDSQRIADVLRPLGYQTTDAADDADMMILNTCHIREKATEKVFSDLGRLKKHKDKAKVNGKRAIIGVAGCVAQAEGDVITTRAPYVDMVFGPQTYHTLAEMVVRLQGGNETRIINTDFPAEAKFDLLPDDRQTDAATAFVSVQEGCDKFCTFCVVPYTRGAEYSRPVQSILDEITRLIETGGIKEITLLGQNVNAYHGLGPDGAVWSLARLMAALQDINGLERIRYTTSHPRDMDDDLIAAHRDLSKVMPFLHLPVQSGSDAILKAMNRKHTAAEYVDIIARLRTARPDIALSSDFIIGFPGETETDFESTLALVRQVGFSSAFSFKYSPRPGTPAAAMAPMLPEKIKAARLQELQNVLFQQQNDFNVAHMGQVMPVLFERVRREDGALHGRTPYNQGINVPGNPRLIGHIEAVRVTQAHTNSMWGEIVVQ
ncbi:MAG: tRNA (N6-isopentenyl adenosine(37)-C2)-methylthiotransferase MiaB [Pseudomonadota bacterium]